MVKYIYDQNINKQIRTVGSFSFVLQISYFTSQTKKYLFFINILLKLRNNYSFSQHKSFNPTWFTPALLCGKLNSLSKT